MENYNFSLPQQSRFFEVEANSEKEAKMILENSKDLSQYEYQDCEVWQPEFQSLNL